METEQQSIFQYLIRRSKKGDRAAQNELYKLFAGAMYNICRRMMGDDDDAKDVLQDAFIEVYTKLGTLKNEDIFPAWIKKIVVNKCINALKKKKGYLTGLEDNFDIPDNADAGNDYVEYEAKRILNALDQISEGCKVIANLYLFEGYDHKEISQILSISESASKAQYSKAKSKIRKILSTKSE